MKYSFAWKVGTVLTFFIYYSGISGLYTYIRRAYLKKPLAMVLTYHRIGTNAKDAITVLQETFDRQLGYLCRHFSVVPLDEMVGHVRSDDWPCADLASITFDDGYRDNLLHAAPLLEKHGVQATVFVVSGWLGAEEMLSMSELLEIRKRGFAIGAHTVTHPRLSQISRDEAEGEIAGSKAELERILNEEVDFFAYPKGKKSDVGIDAMEIARKAGFRAAFVAENGLMNKAVDLYSLPRLGIRDVPLYVFKVRVSGIFECTLFHLARKLMRLT